MSDPKTCRNCREDALHCTCFTFNPEPDPAECIACKWSGVDEAEYAAHGCPSCTCAKPATETAYEIKDKIAWCHRANDTYYTDEEFQEEIKRDPRIVGSYIKFVEASRLIDARLTLIDQEVSRQSALKLLDAARRERDEWKKKYEADVITAVLCKDMETADKLIAANQRIEQLELEIEQRKQLNALNVARIAELESILSGKTFDDQAEAWRAAALRLREALDKVLPAGTWFHLGPYGASPEKDDYDKACLALKEFDAFVSKEKKK